MHEYLNSLNDHVCSPCPSTIMRSVPRSLNWTGGMSERSRVFILSVTPSSSIRTLLVAGRHTHKYHWCISLVSQFKQCCPCAHKLLHMIYMDKEHLGPILASLSCSNLHFGVNLTSDYCVVEPYCIFTNQYQGWPGFWARSVRRVEQRRLLRPHAAPTGSGCEGPHRGPASSHSYCLTETQQGNKDTFKTRFLYYITYTI